MQLNNVFCSVWNTGSPVCQYTTIKGKKPADIKTLLANADYLRWLAFWTYKICCQLRLFTTMIACLRCMQAYASHTPPSLLVASYDRYGDRCGSILLLPATTQVGWTYSLTLISNDNFFKKFIAILFTFRVIARSLLTWSHWIIFRGRCLGLCLAMDSPVIIQPTTYQTIATSVENSFSQLHTSRLFCKSSLTNHFHLSGSSPVISWFHIFLQVSQSVTGTITFHKATNIS